MVTGGELSEGPRPSIVFMGCGAGGGGGAAAKPRRREVVVNGRRVKTVDVHAHCARPRGDGPDGR